MAWEMPLEVLGALVGAGVPVAILLSHLMGGSAKRPLDPQSLQAQLQAQLPGATIADLLICAQGETALLTLGDGRLAVAWPMERHIGLRVLKGQGQLRESSEGLEVDLKDPAWPRRRIQVPDPDLRATWLRKRGHDAAA